METERPHRHTTATTTSSSSSTSELFVCFTSRMSSSSSMKLSSKSLLSPSRSRDPTTTPQISLSASLSRRLRSNGSMKGGQASPMFPAATVGGKRRRGGFENPEPSSPKVTCIGQVRVKTKKQGKKMRAKSKRRSDATSFRKNSTGEGVGSLDLTRQNSSTSFQYNHQQGGGCLKHRNQRWVHLPLTICEALREFNCFFPCRSSCMKREKDEKDEGSRDGKEGSCGAAFARWLQVALQEGGGGGGDDGKRREIEVVMAEEEEEEEEEGGGGGGRSYRRHVFEDIDIDVMEGVMKKGNEEVLSGEEGGGEEKARVSICVPPKNALLLMRCRSDPVKMAALANRFWESPVHKVEQDEEENVEEDEEENGEDVGEEEKQEQVGMGEYEEVRRETEERRNSICGREESSVKSEKEHVEKTEETGEAEETQGLESLEAESSEAHEANQILKEEEEEEEEEGAEEQKEKDEDEKGNDSFQGETSSCDSNPEAPSDLKEPGTQEVEEENENVESLELSSPIETVTASESQNDEAAAQESQAAAAEEGGGGAGLTMAEEASAEEGEALTEEEQQLEQSVTTETPPPPEVTPPTNEGPDPNNEPESEEQGNGSIGEERGRQRETLPECLLMMMCEPKLSMEVSKETWVCSTDFVRWLPERPAAKIPGGGGKGAVKVKKGVDKKLSMAVAPPPPMQPPRSSCSFPAAAGMSMAAMIEQRLAMGPKSNGYEPFVLTRCKSEPMRSTAKLAADSCFWKKPHAPPATLGVGATAGVGF